MDYQQSFAVSALGMSLERMRVDVSALNIANANSVLGAVGAPYQPMRVVSYAQGPFAIPGPSMDAGAFTNMIDRALAAPVAWLEPTAMPPRQMYEPGHPYADAKGFVSYPGVDTATEMMTMLSATRAYEANVAAMNMARAMAMKALEIGGNT
ncbi:flagellar basal body rod protein FlgC [Cupriavidus sp. 30B13]|uniref:flagellar basal body rod protein FlgC n=1 Tax=Cupriavidus sp. 30B13 TaxID=3384241 RepID=UPI003B912B2B